MTAADLERAAMHRRLAEIADLPKADVFIDSGPMVAGSDVRTDFIEGLRAMEAIPYPNRGILAWHASDLIDIEQRWTTL